VTVGNGSVVLVVSEYKDAICSTEAWKVAASVVVVRAHSTQTRVVLKDISRGRPR
jgi:hypothetical protein